MADRNNLVCAYTVTGQDAFPINMLRQDRSVPITEADSYAIVQSFDPMPDNCNKATVSLVRQAKHKNDYPKTEMWESLGWKVTEIEFMHYDVQCP